MQSKSLQLDYPIKPQAQKKPAVYTGWFLATIEYAEMVNNKKNNGVNAELTLRLNESPGKPTIKVILPIQGEYQFLVLKSRNTIAHILSKLGLNEISSLGQLIGLQFMAQIGWNDFYCIINAEKVNN